MASILQYLQNFIASLFALDTKEIECRRQLRAIHRHLRDSGLDYYDRATGHVRPAFAASLLEFVRLLQPLKDIFSKTVGNSDHHLAERYKGFLVSHLLSAKQQEQLTWFGYPGMRDMIEKAPEPRQKLTEISALFHSFIKVFSGSLFADFDRDYAELNRLIIICSHHYRDLLTLFDVSPAMETPGKGHSATPAAGEKAFPHLLDIYFILEGFQISEGLSRNIGALIDRLERERAVETHALVRRCLVRLDKLLRRSLHPDILLALIRLIKADPSLAPAVCTERARYLESYVLALTAHHERDRARIEREISEAAAEEELKRLFPASKLVEIARYDHKTAAKLSSEGFETFTLVKPLTILKNFTLLHYQQRLREPVKKILVEGNFEKKTFQNIFSASFYACEEVREGLRRFEEEISTSGKDVKFSAVRIRNYLELHSRGKNVERLLSEQVAGLNQRALELLEAGICAYYNLATLIEEILADARLKNPVILSNLRALTEKQARTLPDVLEEGRGSLSQLVKILRSFTAVQAVMSPPDAEEPENAPP